MALLKAQKRTAFQKQDVLFREGDEAANIFLLTSGMVRLLRYMPSGRRIVARFVLPGDLIGLSFGDSYPFSAEAIESGTYYKFALTRLNDLSEHSNRLQREVLAALKADSTAEQDEFLSMMHQTAEERIARLLRLLARRGAIEFRDGTIVGLVMTRSDIADYMGLTIETVCRGFAKLRDVGLISSPRAGQIRIENARAVNDLADGEC